MTKLTTFLNTNIFDSAQIIEIIFITEFFYSLHFLLAERIDYKNKFYVS